MKSSAIVAFFLFGIASGDKGIGSVFERDLVAAEISASSIIEEHSRYSSHEAHSRNLDGAVLAYVTPWNNHGYDIVKQMLFLGKFTHVSPVWYRIKRQSDGFALEGSHDVDKPWIDEVRLPNADGDSAKVLPLFQMKQLTQQDYEYLVQTPSAAASLANIILQEVESHSFDGIVFETAIPAKFFVQFISYVCQMLHKNNREFILVVPPKHVYMEHEMFGYDEFVELSGYVDYFSLMTYDYTLPDSSGFNAPVTWMRDNLRRITRDSEDRTKILLGLNMYGFDYDEDVSHSTAITGNSLLSILSRETEFEFEWDEDEMEHSLHYTDPGDGHSHIVHFPTLLSIAERIQIAEEFGTGLSLWEVGQGLDYFFEML